MTLKVDKRNAEREEIFYEPKLKFHVRQLKMFFFCPADELNLESINTPTKYSGIFIVSHETTTTPSGFQKFKIKIESVVNTRKKEFDRNQEKEQIAKGNVVEGQPRLELKTVHSD